MKIHSQQVGKFASFIVILLITFALGFFAGNKKNSVDTPTPLSASDMERAFGSVKTPAHETAMDEPKAMSLNGLVAGLEKKVAANPENIDQQLLLAQTYNELDNREKSLKVLRALSKQAPKNAQVKITLATILMTSSDKKELKEATQSFDEAIKLKPEVAGMARMYQGEIRVKLDELAK